MMDLALGDLGYIASPGAPVLTPLRALAHAAAGAMQSA